MRVKCGNKKAHGAEVVYHASAHEVKCCFTGLNTTPMNADGDITGAPAWVATPVSNLTSSYEVTEQARAGLAPVKGESFTMALLRQQANNAKTYAERGSILAPKTPAPAHENDPFGNGMTRKQHDFLLRLIVDKDTDKTSADIQGLTKQQASRLIGELIATARRPVEAPVDATGMMTDAEAKAARAKREARIDAGMVTQDGVYRNPATGEIFKVQYNRATGDGRQLYAKQMRIVGGDWPGAGAYFEVTEIPSDHAPDGQVEWVYKAGLIRKVQPEWRMTLEEAKVFGALYGQCMRCGRELTNEDSIEAAMGPICRNKKNWG